ncbi:response regulator transcription factor [Hymenobacter taeanensis]|uniref:Response regulator transcription factor n=1 Tax=Hymenobacter taeanensis TaxID=2735321 RepID=A0A6M6BE73_9BACT|nr:MULTISPECIES: LytTR family DNA-binding domain-containing protein [Hymenobacter]QJX45485.1 response regulator transcription factor [Hymenobacter taeanensis]UOQ81267.1 LytTR family DNA-binding domain-containing protein [Hymenobacter sp. 5414T-23]
MLPLPLTCVIVDDNEINRLTLAHLIELTPDLQLVASLVDGIEALNYFQQGSQADILFLDIEMPLLSGLDLPALLPNPAPSIIMVTTHRDFAVHAFALAALDYLVKPVTLERFNVAVSRVREQRLAQAPLLSPPAIPDPHSDASLFVKVGSRMLRVNFDDLLYIEAQSTCSVLITKGQKHVVYSTLKALEERLPLARFARVHRSYIVNTVLIDSVQDNVLRVGSHEVPVGKSYQDTFYRTLRSI